MPSRDGGPPVSRRTGVLGGGADGLIDCWGLVTLDEFEQKPRCGWVATDLPEGAAPRRMDRKDWPFQVLVAGPGGVTERWSDEPVPQKLHDEAVAYFEERARLIAERPSRVPADGPATPHAPAIHQRAAIV
ncbi:MULTISPECIES: DUF7639 domain-containing protein [unclassified Streptomyces]|uniref:DUF7639 domain-containing protein n=1 Tax=unclassified Streptomyces TaxID=2593676 RepID=UPI002E3351F8|nr:MULTISPECIES: hypothetical protein [unclassified Streptomyces]